MPHKYTSFTSAYVAEQTLWSQAKQSVNTSLDQYTEAYLDWIIPDDHAAIGHLLYAVLNAAMAVQKLGDTAASDYLQSAFMECMYWAAQEPSAGDVDMDAIINAMLAAEEDEIDYFIGIVDAYRVSLWNKPFNAEFYAALARGFQEWD